MTLLSKLQFTIVKFKSHITSILITATCYILSTSPLHAVPIGKIGPTNSPLTTNIDSKQSVQNTFNNLISILLGLLTTLAAIYFLFQIVIAGYNWIGSHGDSNQITAARQRLTDGIIGLAIVVGAYMLIGLLANIVGLDDFVYDPLGFLD